MRKHFKSRVGIISGCMNGENGADTWNPLIDGGRCAYSIQFHRLSSSFCFRNETISPRLLCGDELSRAGTPVPLSSASTSHYEVLFWNTCRPQCVHAIEKSPLGACESVVQWQIEVTYPALVARTNAWRSGDHPCDLRLARFLQRGVPSTHDSLRKFARFTHARLVLVVGRT